MYRACDIRTVEIVKIKAVFKASQTKTLCLQNIHFEGKITYFKFKEKTINILTYFLQGRNL